MNQFKKYFALLLAAVLCAGLTACTVSDNNSDTPVIGTDWRVTGIVHGRGTVTRGGEDTVVLVCVHASDADFYYDTEEQVLFDSVDYPIALDGDAREMFQSIDFTDLNGDGNSDVAMRFNDGGNELLMVWFWDTENERFAYQPEESQLGGNDDGRGDIVSDGEGSSDMVSDDEGRGDLF